MNLRLALRAMALWPVARRLVALGAAVACALLLGLPTALVPNPLFGREIPPTWWSYPVLVTSALLAGLLVATYVRTGAERHPDAAWRGDGERPSGDGERLSGDGERLSGGGEGGGERVSRLGSAGALLSFLAVGCPVCNKLVLLALGTSGALTVWAPLQPVLALVSLALLAVAAVRRLSGEVVCPATPAR